MGMLEACQEKTEVVPSVVPLLHVGFGDHILDVEVDGSLVYRDDLTDQVLERKLVHAARQKELDLLNLKHVWSLTAFEENARLTNHP